MDFFIGIDQTGAVDSKGNPKKLSAALIVCRGNATKIHYNLKLQTMTSDEIESLLENLGYKFNLERTYICIDSVLGLPHEYNLTIKEIIKKTQNFSFKNKQYGALTAHAYFNSLKKAKPIFYREIEKKVGANSVFKLKPFQKNIGCGTFRILKELSINSDWYSIWPFETRDARKAIICEGYPSYSWKLYFGLNKRDLNAIHKLFPKLKFKNQDFADSFILAWTLMKNKNKLKKKLNSPEGWILGVK